MTRQSQPPINWQRIENLMRSSISGRGISAEETSYCARALRENLKKYRETHQRIKRQEMDKVSMREPSDG